MERCEPDKCVTNCPFIREWRDEVENIEDNALLLGDYAIKTNQDNAKAKQTFLGIVGEEGILESNFERFLAANEQLDSGGEEFRKLCSKVIENLHDQADELQTEVDEAKDGCSGPLEQTTETDDVRIIGRICMSPVFRNTDGIEPVYIRREPLR